VNPHAARAKRKAVAQPVVQTMEGISGSSKKIADTIGAIDGTAFQTHILALNAAVESARAGEQGQGFAVVASEVRTLAQRSADAAKEIQHLISASVEQLPGAGRHAVQHQVEQAHVLLSAMHVALRRAALGFAPGEGDLHHQQLRPAAWASSSGRRRTTTTSTRKSCMAAATAGWWSSCAATCTRC
jgi:hypothetical protein